MARRRINLLRIESPKELEEWQASLRSRPGYAGGGQDLSEQGLHQKMSADYTVVERIALRPWDGPVEPGTMIYTTWNGVQAWWLNGTVYVRNDVYERYKREHPEEE